MAGEDDELALRDEEPLDRDSLDDIDVFATAVVPFTRQTFRVLIGEDRSLRLHHRPARGFCR